MLRSNVKVRCFILIVCTLYIANINLFAQYNSKYVNPFIGTGAVGKSLSGNTYPGATVPFGMVQLSPDTRDVPDWDAACGYDYNDKTIAGFSHTHLSGTGVAELFDVLIMPTVGKTVPYAGTVENPESGYRSRFSHEHETAKPGYYAVKLLDYGINAELTATAHSGFHRYNFPKNRDKHVVIDLNHSLNKGSWSTKIIQSQFRVINKNTIVGYRIITGWAKLRKVYFYAEFSKPILNYKTFNGEQQFKNTAVINGNNLRLVADFGTNEQEDQLQIKVGFSATCTENAKQNLQAEIPAWDFDQTVNQATQTWEKELDKIQIEGTSNQKELFYTALYHTLLQPNNLADVNGDYMGTDYVVRNARDKAHYSTFSLWDTYRAVHPLYTLIATDKTSNFINSLIRQYQTYGHLPVWQLWGQENYCMIGNHAIPVIADAILKNIQGIDVENAYEAIKNSSLRSHLNSPFEIWEKYGYIPENIQSQSVSITLEMAYDDWCVAQIAKKLGKHDDEKHFLKRSEFYKNLYDSKTGFFRAKDDKGDWLNPFDPLKYGSNGGHPFTEGNAWQYFWYVPQNIPNLIKLVGGKKDFTNKLDDFFTLNNRPEQINGNASGFIGQYAHGNEPSHHVSYLYNYAGEPWKTQFYTNKILTELYNTSSSGYAGNDDCGQMSAWYVFSAIGFYPVNPANSSYEIGSPLLQKTIINLQNGKHFTVLAPRKNEKEIYIQSAKLNGQNFDRTTISHSEILNGGILVFKMGSKPQKRWGLKSH